MIMLYPLKINFKKYDFVRKNYIVKNCQKYNILESLVAWF